jgi:hypothetical protein
MPVHDDIGYAEQNAIDGICGLFCCALIYWTMKCEKQTAGFEVLTFGEFCLLGYIAVLATCFTLVSCFPRSSSLKEEAT